MEHNKPRRKVFYLLLLSVLAVAGGNLAKAADDNLNIVFTTTNAGGSYGNKHVHVVWIENSIGNFVYTAGSTTTDNKRALWANSRASSLKEWWNANGANRSADVVARTGATQTAYKTYNFNWNWRKKDGTVLPDGNYQVHFLCTNSDSGTPNNKAVFNITKGPSPQTVGPTSQGGYNNVKLIFTPGVIAAPVVTNSPAANITSASATLKGNVTQDSNVTIYWGDNDGGTGTWDSQINVGSVLAGNFSANISLPLPDTTYYFRCYATNAGGSDWANSSSSFTSAPAVSKIHLSGQSLNFGKIAVGSHSDLTFDITNNGDGQDLVVESFEITGLSKSAYSIISAPSIPFSLAPGAPGQSITVRFEPTVYAENYACVSIGSNDPDLTVADLSLTGTGTMEAEVSLSALSGIGGICNAVVPVGSNLFVAQGAMLTILDASNPSNLQLAGQVRLADIIQDITVAGNTAYAAIGASGIQAVDVTNLSAPIALEVFDTPGHAYEVAASDSTLCVADGPNGLVIYDISTHGTPIAKYIQPTGGSATAVTISGTKVYVLDDMSGLQIIDTVDTISMEAHLKLNSNALDSTGNYNGIAKGTPVWLPDGGQFDGAIQLNGDDYVEIEGYAGVMAAQPRTISAWIKTTSTDGWQPIANWGGAGTGGRWTFAINPTTSSLYIMVQGDNFSVEVPGINDGQWHHVAVTWEDDGTPDCDDAVLYYDGTPHTSVDDTFVAVNTVAGTEDVTIGKWGTNYFNGSIDEVRIYDSALNSSQIQSLYNGYSNPLDEIELGQALAVSATTACVTDQIGNFFVIDITDPAAPSLLGKTRVSAGNGTSIAISGDYAYVTNTSGVEVFNISAPATPVSEGSYSCTQASDVAISGTVAYLAEKGFGLRSLDLTSPAAPASIGYFSFQAMPKAVAAGTSTAIIAGDTDGMQVAGLTDPANPEALSSTSTGALGYAQDVAVNGSLGYLANGFLGLQIVDLTNPAVPVLLGDYPTLGFASSVAVSGSTAMISDGRSVYVLDVSDSSSPSLNGHWISGGWAGGVAINGQYGYVANGAMGIEVLNISDATSAGSLELPGVAYDISVSGGTAYVAAGSGGLQIIDVSTPASPSVITSFDTPGMALGITVVGSRVCVADKYSVAVINVSTPAAPSLYAISDVPVNSLGTDVVNSRLLVADGNAGVAILRAHLQPNIPLGDFNGSGKVTILDLAMLAGDWMATETMLDVLAANITDDTTVDLQDYALMARNWGVGTELSAPTVINADAANITSNSARLNGQVTDNGNEDPTVTVFWGDNDGGTTPGNWDHHDTIGIRSSAFFDDISSLSSSTTYFFRVYAANSAGSDWADSTASFTTNVTHHTIEVRVATGNDDAEEGKGTADGVMYLDSSDLELINDDGFVGDDQVIGIRFNNISIPNGAHITNAYIQFACDETNNANPCNLTIYAENSDNAGAFSSSSHNVSNRSKTSGIAWNPPDWTSAGAAGVGQQTPNIASIIEMVTARSGWQSGNSIVFIITGTGRRTAESYDGSSGTAPLLHVEF